MSNRVLIVLVAVASMAVSQRSSAQTVVAQLLHADSGSTLTLTPREVVFEFTPVGIERARRRAESTMAGYADRRLANLVRTSLNGAFRDMRIQFEIADIIVTLRCGGGRACVVA